MIAGRAEHQVRDAASRRGHHLAVLDDRICPVRVLDDLRLVFAIWAGDRLHHRRQLTFTGVGECPMGDVTGFAENSRAVQRLEREPSAAPRSSRLAPPDSLPSALRAARQGSKNFRIGLAISSWPLEDSFPRDGGRWVVDDFGTTREYAQNSICRPTEFPKRIANYRGNPLKKETGSEPHCSFVERFGLPAGACPLFNTPMRKCRIELFKRKT